MADEPDLLRLPIGLATRADAGRLLREAEAIGDFLRQAAIRKPGTSLKLPKSSQLLDELLDANKLNMLQADDRERAAKALRKIYSSAPLLHMSFATEPSPLFLQKLMEWLRQNIHPNVLLQIGLQPSLGAGCVIRSTNKYFDFSLRQRFSDQRNLLINMLRETNPSPQPAAPLSGQDLAV